MLRDRRPEMEILLLGVFPRGAQPDDKMRLRNRPVTLLRTSGDVIYVREGLDDGDLVSLTNLDNSFDSTEVRIHSRTPTNALDASGKPRQAQEDGLQEATAAVQNSTEASGG